MKRIKANLLPFVAALAVGCSAAGANSGGAPSGAGGRQSGSGGSMSAGGFAGGKADAGMVVTSDAGSARDGAVEKVTSNLGADAISFNWDSLTCVGCGATGGAGPGGSSGAAGGAGASGTGQPSGGGGAPGVGGASAAGGRTGPGGSVGTGGAMAGSGGVPGTGGSKVTGGSTGAGLGGAGEGGAVGAGGQTTSGADAASPPSDASTVAADARSDLATADAGADARIADAAGPPPDARGPDGADALVPCEAQIVSVVPTTPWLGRLVAGKNTRVVLRAEITSGALPAGTPWNWQATWKGMPLSVSAVGQSDLAAAAFAIASPGDYTFRATAGACQATVSASAVAADICPACDTSVIVSAAAPAAANLPVQSGPVSLLGSSPFDQSDVVLAHGVSVRVSPSVGTSLVRSYVRITDLAGALVVDGLADPNAGGFSGQLLAVAQDQQKSVLRYDVLVVPMDSSGADTVNATAPQLFQNLTASGISGSFALAGGVSLTGTATSVDGTPISDVRVMMSNQNPAASSQTPDLLFSSLGRSDDQGKFSFHVQKGTYWVSFSPPVGSGLAEATGSSSIAVVGDSTLALQWDGSPTATLAVKVVDASGGPLSGGASVRVTSSQSRQVGSLTVTPAGGQSASQAANGNVEVEGTTDTDGNVAFSGLPANASYDLLLIPAQPGANAATTTASVTLAAGGTSVALPLSPQASIVGKLQAPTSGLPAPSSWASVSIVAYDRGGDAPESPRVAAVNADGSFVVGVTPGRPYVLLAVPAGGSGYARTFVGPGPLEASEFTITQALLASMTWKATVMDEYQVGSADTALQVFCGESWPNCVDPAVPLAETTSDGSGAFSLALPDPSSR